MALAPVPTRPPEVLPPPGRINVAVTKPQYHNNVVDSQKTPLAGIIVGIEGSNYTINYYSQVLGSDNLLKPFEPTQLSAYQQYYLIKNYQLKIQSSLEPQDDTPTNVMSYKGSAILYPGLIPNIGDVIVGDVGDGYAGQFTVTNVAKATMFEQSTWRIDFEMVRYMTADIEANLASKVVQEGTFVANNLIYGQNPIVADSTLAANASLTATIQSLGAIWFSEFNSQEYKTSLVGGQLKSTYDPFLMRGMLRVFDVTDFPQIRKLKVLNISDFELTEYFDFWTMLSNVNGGELPRCFTTAYAAPTSRFSWQPYFDSIRYSGVDMCVVPGEMNRTADSELATYTEPYGWPLDKPLTPTVTDPNLTLPALSLTDNSYVLSSGFWDGTQLGLSGLEYLVRGFLAGEAVDENILYGYCDAAATWSRYERYYYIPILLIILKTTLLAPI